MQSRLSQFASQAIITIAIAALVALGGRLIYINASDGPRLLARARQQHRSDVPLPHRRGLIVDARGRIISGTMLRKSVFADPTVLPDKDAAAAEASRILGLDIAELSEDLLAAGDRRFFVIKRGISQAQAAQIKAAGIYGLGVFDEPYRTYPMNGLAAALIGFSSSDGNGVSGLEHQCDAWLRGENGVKTIIRDARRKAFWLADGGYRPARDGFHVVLTIDTEIQAAVERELAACVQQFRAESGTVVVMHPGTGAVLAMANYPGFDPNHYGDYGASLYRNRAITDPFEPGSTFKPFIATAALAEGVVKLGDLIDCEDGLWQDGARTLHDHHPQGLLTFEEVIIKSSNIGMAKLGKRLGNRKLCEYVRAFGFGQKTGIDLDGEDAGIMRPEHRWNTFSTTSIPMGQEIGVTALQMVRAFCALANGGRLVQPYVIRAVVAADGNVISDFSQPPPAAQILDPTVANIMKERILAAVVDKGTGTKAKLAGYQVFGKTGTAQIARQGGGGYERNAYVSSFIGAAPLHDPQLVVLVSVRRPDRSLGYYGGTVAAPAVRAILAHSLAYLQVPPDRPFAAVTDAGPVLDND
ncbi:MAG: penicillin-binding protein 2 [Planctomycetota bacterium]